MNQIRAIQALNKREIENGIPPEASWHVDYRDTAFVYFGGLPYELSEGDVVTIFSQFGEPVYLKLARDQETGKSKGFGWLKYEDQRSTDLAVDNLGGAEIGGRLVRVDHARYKMRDDEDPEEGKVGWEDMVRRERAEKGGVSEPDTEDDEGEVEERGKNRPLLKEEKELQLLIENHDDEDPMKAYLIDEKKKEVEEALRREQKSEKHSHRHRHRDHDRHHRSSHRSRRDDDDKDRRRDEDKSRDRDGGRRRDKDRAGRVPESRKERSRRDDTPVEGRRQEDKDGGEGRHEGRPRDSRDRGADGAKYRERAEDRRRRDDSDEEDRGNRNRHSRRYDSLNAGDSRDKSREDRRHRDPEDRSRRDRNRSRRSRSPRRYRD